MMHMNDESDTSKDLSTSNNKQLEIECIFYCKFDEYHGPKLVCSDPKNFLNEINLNFEKLTKFLLPDDILKLQVISLKIGKWCILGVPVILKHSKYTRNSFAFSICFIVKINTNEEAIRLIAPHVAYAFQQLEVETSKLSVDGNEEDILKHLKNLRKKLNSENKAHLRFSPQNDLCLLVRNQYAFPSNLSIEKVPLPSKNLYKLLRYITKTSHIPLMLDLTFIQILPYLDGIRPVSAVAADAHVDLECVDACIHHLSCYRLISLIDIYGLSNTYRLTSAFATAWEDSNRCRRVLSYIVGGPSIMRRMVEQNLPRISIGYVILLYSYLGDPLKAHGECLAAFIQRYEYWLQWYSISLRHFVAFGVSNGFLRRVHEYPVAVEIDNFFGMPPEDTNEVRQHDVEGLMELKEATEIRRDVQPSLHVESLTDSTAENSSSTNLLQYADGSHTFDWISCRFGLPKDRLKLKLSLDAQREKKRIIWLHL